MQIREIQEHGRIAIFQNDPEKDYCPYYGELDNGKIICFGKRERLNGPKQEKWEYIYSFGMGVFAWTPVRLIRERTNETL